MRSGEGDHALRYPPLVPERWHRPLSASEVEDEIAAELEQDERPAEGAEHTVSEIGVEEALREIASEKAEAAPE